jgi:hypothetical protein
VKGEEELGLPLREPAELETLIGLLRKQNLVKNLVHLILNKLVPKKSFNKKNKYKEIVRKNLKTEAIINVMLDESNRSDNRLEIKSYFTALKIQEKRHDHDS